jgi:hypothetical protein
VHQGSATESADERCIAFLALERIIRQATGFVDSGSPKWGVIVGGSARSNCPGVPDTLNNVARSQRLQR